MNTKKKLSTLPQISSIAQSWLNKIESPSNTYIQRSLQRQSAIEAVDRIMIYGRNERGERLQDTLWFRQQLRLTCDNRIKHLLTTGASQVSKSLGNYLDCIDTILHGQINIGWFYASRQSMFNQQPEQFQRMINFWIRGLGDNFKLDVQRDSISRYSVGRATANFSYANSSSQEKEGGATEGKENASFSASKIYIEEASSTKSNFDVTPRLGASRLPSKPIRELGTPGSGQGIERMIKEAVHNFFPGTICDRCNCLTWLEPKGALLKPKIHPKTKKEQYFNVRGEILDYYSHCGTPITAYVACVHCGGEITTDKIENCQLYSKQTEESIDDFLYRLPDGEVFIHPISIHLSPLLRVPTDPYRLEELIREGLDPKNPSIYQQNKLGYPSSLQSNSVSIDDYEATIKLPFVNFENRLVKRFIGIDQGRDSHWAVIIENDMKSSTKQILFADMVDDSKICDLIDTYKVTLGIIDNEPERKAAFEIAERSNNVLVLGDQRSLDVDFKEILVKHGTTEYNAYAVNQNRFKDLLIAQFKEGLYRIDCTPHRKFMKHLTGVYRDIDTYKYIRPADKDDDLFFALMFAEAALYLHKSSDKKIGASGIVSGHLKMPGNPKKQPLRNMMYSPYNR